jgi:hypothetical protein
MRAMQSGREAAWFGHAGSIAAMSRARVRASRIRAAEGFARRPTDDTELLPLSGSFAAGNTTLFGFRGCPGG